MSVHVISTSLHAVLLTKMETASWRGREGRDSAKDRETQRERERERERESVRETWEW